MIEDAQRERYGGESMAPPTLARTAQRGDETRRALLSAAHDLLATEGPAALSVRRIAAAAGVSTMNVYSRFGGKDGVLEELYIDGFARLGDAVVDFQPSGDALDDLRRCGVGYRQFALENPTYYSLMFDKPVPEFEPSNGALEAALAALARVVDRVERAMAAGALAPGDPFEVATGLWACQHGLVTLQMRHPDDGVFDWPAIAEATIDAVLRGYAVASPQSSNEDAAPSPASAE
jgi:AcrR family transcriptional regulator